MPQGDREKLSEREIADLSDSEREKFEGTIKALEALADAEAKHESQKKMRILFERAPAETLPFIVYVIYMGAVSLPILWKILDYDGTKLILGAILLLVLMILPLFLLPHESFKKFFRWLRNKLTGQEMVEIEQ